MMEPDTTRGEVSVARQRTEAREERFTWPPSATAVWLFMVLAFMLGGPATWWAVTR